MAAPLLQGLTGRKGQLGSKAPPAAGVLAKCGSAPTLPSPSSAASAAAASAAAASAVASAVVQSSGAGGSASAGSLKRPKKKPGRQSRQQLFPAGALPLAEEGSGRSSSKLQRNRSLPLLQQQHPPPVARGRKELLQKAGVFQAAERAKLGFVVQSGNNALLVRELLRKRRQWVPAPGDPNAPYGKLAFSGNSLIVEEVPSTSPEMNLLWTAYRTAELLDAMEHSTGLYVSLNSQKKLQLDEMSKAPAMRIHNHFDGNQVLCRKCELRETLVGFFAPRGLDPFGVMPASYVVRTGSRDPEYSRWKARFERESAERGECIWLVKPGSHSNQGRGIEVFDSEEGVRQMVDSRERPWVIQKYIERPLLIVEGRKFDVRMFGLIMQEANQGPFHAYFFNDGYVRTTSVRFSKDNLDRRFHITNDQVQRLDSDYGKFEEGNKMSLADLKAYFLQTSHGIDGFERMLAQMRAIVVDTTRAAIDQLNPRGLEHCFELFGFDFMIDEDGRVWLLEVNTDPSLEVHSRHQSELIPAVVDGVLRLTVDRISGGAAVLRNVAPTAGSSMCWEHVYCSADDDAAADRARAANPGPGGSVACHWVERLPAAEAEELARLSAASCMASSKSF